MFEQKARALGNLHKISLETLEAASVGIVVLANYWADLVVKGRPVVWRKWAKQAAEGQGGASAQVVFQTSGFHARPS